MPLKVSVIIITRHRPDMLHACLEHLDKERDQDLEVVIADNSDPGKNESSKVAENFQWAIYLRIPHDRSFITGSRNSGARRATGEIYAFIDDDSMVYPGWLAACREAYSDQKVGAVGGRILDPEVENLDPLRNDPIGKIYPNGYLSDNFDCTPKNTVQVQHLRGCNCSIRQSLFERLGGFDENIKGYGFDEFDLCLRITKAGYKIVHHTPMQIYHRLSPRENSERITVSYKPRKTNIRNLSYSLAKHYGQFGITFLRFSFNLTPLKKLIRKPSGANFLLLIATLHGRIEGFLASLTTRKIHIQ
ncbi:MAG: glycosyltransferase [Opitutales bacterium]|nr:glycosyltransferase [Opitutales bacterium]